MTQIFHSMIAAILGISEKQIGQTLSLLDDGATIPFISRYRKEMTGGLDEVQIESIRTHYEKLKETAKRKETIVATIREQGKMTPELQKRIDDTWDSTALEDIYLPYKPKRRTRATVARERGLEPLADLVMAQRARDAAQQARRYVSAEVPTPEDALAGACDIIAEKQYGYKRLPVFMLARDGEILSDDPRKTTIERGGTHIHPVSGKFMDDDLTYIQRESGDVQYIVTFHREGDYNQRSILEVVPAWKRVLAKAIGMNPTYIRVKGTVGVEERRCGVGDAYKAQGLWEQYFMGSNKLAIIESKTVPLSDDTAK